jgi:hypothetical protein
MILSSSPSADAGNKVNPAMSPESSIKIRDEIRCFLLIVCILQEDLGWCPNIRSGNLKYLIITSKVGRLTPPHLIIVSDVSDLHSD